MKVTIQLDDKHRVQAVYFEISDNQVHKTIEIDKEVFLDVDSQGKAVGLELLYPTPRVVGLMKQIAADYELPQLAKSHPEKLQAAFA